MGFAGAHGSNGSNVPLGGRQAQFDLLVANLFVGGWPRETIDDYLRALKFDKKVVGIDTNVKAALDRSGVYWNRIERRYKRRVTL